MRWKLYKVGKFLVTGAVIIFGIGMISADAETSVAEQKSVQVANNVNGWQKNGNGTYYYQDGKPVKGEQYIDGNWYLFDATTGVMKVGLQDLSHYGSNKVVYYDAASGAMQHGSVAINGKTLTFDSNTGALRLGWYNGSTGATTNPDGSVVTPKYYVTKSGVVTGEQFIENKWYLFNTAGNMMTGLVKQSNYGMQSNKTVLYGSDGAMKYGQQAYNGGWYLFDKSTGSMQTGLQDLSSYGENKTVYYDPTTGKMQYGTIVVDGKRLTFENGSGALHTGWYTDTSVSNVTNPDGSVTTNKYYATKNGVTVGEKYIDGKWRLFDGNGRMITGMVKMSDYGVLSDRVVLYGDDGGMKYGQQAYKGSWYLFDQNDGARKTGIQDLKAYGEDKTVYYDPNSGAMQYGQVNVNGKTLSFAKDTGALQTGWFVDKSFATINNPDGSVTTNRYYVTRDGVATGEKSIQNHWYLFDKNGHMITGMVKQSVYGVASDKTALYGSDGQMRYGEQSYNGAWYLFGKNDGARKTGLQDLTAYGQNKVVYYDPETGKMVYGDVTVDGRKLTFVKDTGALKYGWYQDTQISEKQNADGSVTTNRYYVNKSGVTHGEAAVGGKWYLFDQNGFMITGMVQLSNYGVSSNRIVLYGADGTMRYGQQAYKGAWYLFKNGDGSRQTGLQDLDAYGANKVVYYNADGIMSHDTGVVGGKTYRFDSQTGAIKDEDFFAINGHWYYTRAGSFAKGQQYINNHWYLFSKYDKTMQYGLQNLSDYGQSKVVCYDPQMGWMSYGTRNINNGTYTFSNGDGHLSSVVLNHQWYSQLNQGAPEGCEAASLQIGMSVHGRWASLQDIYNATSYGYGVTPYNGFYGNPWGGGSSKVETIFPDAVVSKAQRVTGRLQNMTGASVNDIKQQLTNGNAVVTWGNYHWSLANPLSFHVMTIVGYNDNSFLISDPYSTTFREYWISQGTWSYVNSNNYAVGWNTPRSMNVAVLP